jgi:hypothetical protein
MRRRWGLAAHVGLLLAESAALFWYAGPASPSRPAACRQPTVPCSYKSYTVPDRDYFFLMLKPSPPGEAPELWWDHVEDGDPSTVRYTKSGMYRNDGSGVPLWTVDWYAPRVDPAADGVHAVRLEPCAADCGGEVIGFIAGGRVLGSYRIEDLVERPGALDRSCGYVRWLAGDRFDQGRLVYTVRTTEGRRIRFDVRSGRMIGGVAER